MQGVVIGEGLLEVLKSQWDLRKVWELARWRGVERGR